MSKSREKVLNVNSNDGMANNTKARVKHSTRIGRTEMKSSQAKASTEIQSTITFHDVMKSQIVSYFY